MITLKSHGFKFNRPEANIMFDVSYFKNPWRQENIREELSREGRNQKVIEFMMKQGGVHDMANAIKNIIMKYNELYPDENIQVAICCSAGEYRSPAMVEIVKKLLPTGFPIIIKHSENSKI